jgi:hypothetical protein
MNAADWAALAIAWGAGALIWGVLIGAFIRHGNPTDEIEAADWAAWETDPPEWEPDDTEAQRIAEQFAEAAAEEDHRYD